MNSYYRAHTDPIFLKLKVLKIKDLILLSRATFIHQYRSGYLPASFDRNYFDYISEEESGRRDDPLCLSTPSIPYELKSLERSPYIILCKDWNRVPYEIKLIAKESTFKRALTDYLLFFYNDICTVINCRACIFGELNYSSS